MAKVDRYLVLAILLVGLFYLLVDRNDPGNHYTVIYHNKDEGAVNVPQPALKPQPDSVKAPVNLAQANTERKRVLVTGAAGFIGMHLSIELSKRNNFVVGVDNLNDYYDPELKRDRAYELHKLNVKLYKADVCDAQVMDALMRKYKFTHVAHLAAQAGVRYSLKNPLAYIKSNVECFVTLLEVVRNYPGVKVVYASSSSVYGRNTKVPFSVSDEINTPSSLYAATKKADEDIARVYHHLYKIPITGLRFFTVYGPWGRPDMAVYDFSDKMMAGKPINVYSHGVLQRDFTYIDDTVNGIIAAINYGADFELFNLGKGHPDYVNELIELLEKNLRLKAKRNEMPLQPGDVTLTYADMDHTYEKLGFKPQIPLEEGVAKWTRWYMAYRDYREKGDFTREQEYLKTLEASTRALVNGEEEEDEDVNFG